MAFPGFIVDQVAIEPYEIPLDPGYDGIAWWSHEGVEDGDIVRETGVPLEIRTFLGGSGQEIVYEYGFGYVVLEARITLDNVFSVVLIDATNGYENEINVCAPSEPTTWDRCE